MMTIAKDGDVAKLGQALKKLKDSYECPAAKEARADNILADALLKTARELAPRDSGAAFALIEQAESLHASWAAAAALADAWYKRRNYPEAARAYQEALRLLLDPDNENKPSLQVSIQLRKRADETRHLAAAETGTLVRGLATRAVTSTRGMAGGRVPVPVLFVYNQDVFTPVGEQAALELAEFLMSMKFKSITLIGHTDPIGGEAFNMELSRRRAEAVRSYLGQKGLDTTAITVVAKGKTEPVVLSNDNHYSQDQIYELDRRVEFSPQD
jgi:outer membrane protein OmpA-like peptidoglycan-associated protein